MDDPAQFRFFGNWYPRTCIPKEGACSADDLIDSSSCHTTVYGILVDNGDRFAFLKCGRLDEFDQADVPMDVVKAAQE